ncbi:MAG: hypothetical protein DHS20C05_09970 [Hyphococcus sp.]|nr:MAG: hypothetical protein DHS20C05_09970 [Marinicaulis sp.]
MRVISIFFAACFILFAPLANANAADVSRQDILRALTAQGLNAQEAQDNQIRVEVAQYRIYIWLAGADGDISYATWLPGVSSDEVSLKVLNDFNNDTKFGRAYADDNGDIYLQMDRNSAGGVSIKNIESDFDVFLSLIHKFMTDLESQRIA